MPLRKAKSKANCSGNQTISNSEIRSARLFTVKGRVQGVWFRDSTRREAKRLNINGYAKNLANGDVEVAAFGSPEALRALGQWLHDGPPMAKVADVLEQQIEYQSLKSFEIT